MFAKKFTTILSFFFIMHATFLQSSSFIEGDHRLVEYKQEVTDGFPARITIYSTNDQEWKAGNYIVQSVCALSSTVDERVFKNNECIATRNFDTIEPPAKNLYTFFIESLQS